MYKVSTDLYLEVLEQLYDQIGSDGYYSGSFEFDYGELLCSVILSAVIYRSTVTMPEGCTEHRVADVVPVWWEFHTYIDGDEVLNDFSFNTLREYIN